MNRFNKFSEIVDLIDELDGLVSRLNTNADEYEERELLTSITDRLYDIKEDITDWYDKKY